MKQPTHHYAVCHCPTCGHPLSAATNANEKDPDLGPPRAGDLSVCCYCGDILAFNSDCSSRVADLNDLLRTPTHLRDELERISRHIRFNKTT